MRSGRSPGAAQGGYTYIALLIAVAVIGVGLAATGLVWSHSRQREKEQELLFVGDQFRQAIERYYERTPGPAKRYPQSLEDLVADQRFPKPERHLRRIYADPMTGKPEWGLISAPGGGIMGVYSRSSAAPIKNAGFRDKDRTNQGATNYYEWRFFYEGAVPAAPAASPEPAPASGSSAPAAGGAAGPTPNAAGGTARPAAPAQKPAAAPSAAAPRAR